MSEYDTDILTWSEHQAALLCRRAAGELVNDAEMDWPNIAEEIGDVGKSVVRGVASHLVQAILHDLKADAWPLSREAPHWRAEARVQRDEAQAAYAPSMADRDELNVEKLYRRALRGMPETIDGQQPLPVTDVCTVTLEELLGEP
jgi:hypothetical protein